jgi:hypothetical protein
MLHASGSPRFLWTEAACHAVWLKYCTPTKALSDTTPYDAAYGKKPNLHRLHEWGCHVWVKTEASGNKLGRQVQEGVWVGYDEQSKGSHIFWFEKQTVSMEHNIYFD